MPTNLSHFQLKVKRVRGIMSVMKTILLWVMAIMMVYGFVPSSQAALRIVEGTSATFTASTCDTPASYSGNDFVPATGCESKELQVLDSSARTYVDKEGYVYSEVCADAPKGTSGGGLSIVPSSCNFVATGARDLSFISTPAPNPSPAIDTADPTAAAESNAPTAAPTAAGGIVPACREGEENCANPYAPENYGFCELVVMASNVMGFLISLLGVVTVLVVVYVGFLYVTSLGKPDQISRGRQMFTNLVIGFVIALCAYLIVNTILSVLVGQNSSLVQWNTISECVYEGTVGDASYGLNVSPYKADTLFEPRVMTKDETVYNDAILRSLGGEAYKSGDCSPENLQRLGMSATQAKVFSCIARPESGCNLNADNPDSTARGVFQVLRGYNDKCHNLNLSACTTAAQKAGYTVSGNLNCSQAFSGGQRKLGANPLADACDAAASDMACNVAATLCLYNKEDGGSGGYKPWLGVPDKNHHLSQRACVTKYGE